MEELIKLMMMECAIDYESAENCDETIEDIASNVYNKYKPEILKNIEVIDPEIVSPKK